MRHFTGQRGKADAFGNGINTQAHQINRVMSRDPQSIQEICAATKVANLQRVSNHLQWLKARGFVERHRGDRWSLTEKGHLLYSGDGKGVEASVELAPHPGTRAKTE